MAEPAEELVALCRSVGISSLVLVRHANAAPLQTGAPAREDRPHDWKRADQMRVLTERGRAQCAAASEWFRTLPLRALLTSPARRASETAMRMMAQVETEESKADTLFLQMVEGVHPAGMSEKCEELFEVLGYGPLRKFFDAPGGREAFCDYGGRVAAELLVASRQLPAAPQPTEPEASCVGIFGHAVFLNAIAFGLAVAAGALPAVQDELLDMDLGETEGIFIDLADGRVEHKRAASPQEGE
eukprot:CAMPEP_0179072410 /NCGR_PEP_ID=MMETSP0796-20121207/32041_1 /TAXON_ID=73915 /ORGANISM="Pyrodinium bahamense, Strain pbaha01" /LENGTH=242 /DNA_ID=CAMNT_0020769571 /DNA_START=87 /DNA_END=815 /DNA_ORIENTATION=+